MRREALGPELEKTLILLCMEGTPTVFWKKLEPKTADNGIIRGYETRELRLPDGIRTARLMLGPKDDGNGAIRDGFSIEIEREGRVDTIDIDLSRRSKDRIITQNIWKQLSIYTLRNKRIA
jgi:hypothetical protein